MNSAPIAWSSLLILLIGGCQQPSNPAIPLSPVGPLGASTRVPPPQTGSYAVPNGYYQGQASVAPANSGQFAAAVSAGPNSVVSTHPGPDAVATETPTLNGWSDAAAGPTVSPVQPAAYQDAGSQMGTGFAAAPRIPASALQHSAAGGAPLRPELDGMEVLDLTAPEPLQPTAPPTLRVIDRGQMQAAASLSDGSAAPTFRSLSPAEFNPAAARSGQSSAAPSSIAQVSATGTDTVAAPQSTTGVTARANADAPSTSKAAEGTTKSADLPWRKPVR